MADVRRDQMLAAAATLIAERGFTETRIADVAARVGASPALVIYYFRTKDNLLTEALRWSESAWYDAVYADAGDHHLLQGPPRDAGRLDLAPGCPR